MNIDWTYIGTVIFGQEEGWLGWDWGFWLGMIFVALIVVFENWFFWTRKSYEQIQADKAKKAAKI
ncbi:MAG: hypothetical protein LUH11_01880 [Candidatus Gastranaerophilales bacterium]|nr:hypothetical protein [Candidatus Gastranaerophilales bacterium]